MMKILHVITTINRGGAENHLIDLIRMQRLRGLNVSVAYLKGDGYWEKEFNKIEVCVYPLNLKRYGNIAPLIKLKKIINSNQYDIIHAHMPPAELYTRFALITKSVPLIITKHNVGKFCNCFIDGFLSKWVTKRAAKVIAISNEVLRYIKTKPYSVKGNRATRIYYGLNTTPYETILQIQINKLKEEIDISDDTYILGTVARLTKQKSLHVLLNAYRTFNKTYNVKSKLVIVGRGELENQLKKLAKKLDISDNVIWLGFREDIPLIMNLFDIFILTSKYEGLGLVMLEAMAANKPVVASNVSPMSEIVQDGTTGKLFEYGNSEALSKLMFKFCNVEYKKKYTDNIKQYVRKNYSLSDMEEKTFNIYKEATKR